MKLPKLALMGISVLLLISTVTRADKGGNGGNWTEGDLKHFLEKLVPYIKSPEGQALFPEVVAYDKSHPNETFEDVLAELNPSLVNHPVYESSGNERDCVSSFDKVRYFQCNVNALPPKPNNNASGEHDYFGSLYRLVLHEGFVQVGLEKPLTKEVPSEYPLSSRLNVHLENFPEWVPGIDPKLPQTSSRDLLPLYTLPLGTKVRFPVDTVIPASHAHDPWEWVELNRMSLGNGDYHSCQLVVVGNGSDRTLSGFIEIDFNSSAPSLYNGTPGPEQSSGDYVLFNIDPLADYMDRTKDVPTFNGKPNRDILKMDCGTYNNRGILADYLNHDWNVAMFKKYIESLGGTVQLPAPAPF